MSRRHSEPPDNRLILINSTAVQFLARGKMSWHIIVALDSVNQRRRDGQKMAKTCAYCGVERAATREHIWPKNILEKTSYNIRYSERAGKTFSGDMIVKDVCAICNNGPLSVLDAYAGQLYDAYFGKFERAREAVEFSYDFGKLTRWLLKISYNASRGTGVDSKLLAQYAPAIISEYECSPAHVGVFIGRIRPSRKSNGQLTKPTGARCGRTLIADGAYDQWCATRIVTINTYMFNIFVIRNTAFDASQIQPLFQHLHGVPLHPRGSVVIPVPTIDTLQAMSGVESWPRGH
jgi:hypothetical protein